MVEALPGRVPAQVTSGRADEKSGGIVFEDDLPKRKIGVLSPLPVIDNGPFEFYRLVKDRIMLVLIPVGLAEFTDKDVERVFAPIDSYLDKLMERRVDIVVQSGVPLARADRGCGT